ncbi:MAG: PEP-CTERM sorting domain-containing protein [Moraxellaceae bacterium]|nr:PEP-CTERM sorting domain-containing protein [Moraxellaceae bacterium]
MPAKILRRLATIAAVCTAAAASAAPITYNFSASDFQLANGAGAAPVSSVSGSFTVEGFTLQSIDFTLGSHTYATADLLFGPTGLGVALGGAPHLLFLNFGTEDFGLVFDPATLAFNQFAYTTTGTAGAWSTRTGSVTVASVPAPASALLIGLGLLASAAARRRRA